MKDIQSIKFYGVDYSQVKIFGADESPIQFKDAFRRINELYITSQSSNQLDLWAVMDAFGLKLRGIGFFDNADYIVDVERWGSSNLPETLAALRFSFKEEQQ